MSKVQVILPNWYWKISVWHSKLSNKIWKLDESQRKTQFKPGLMWVPLYPNRSKTFITLLYKPWRFPERGYLNIESRKTGQKPGHHRTSVSAELWSKLIFQHLQIQLIYSSRLNGKFSSQDWFLFESLSHAACLTLLTLLSSRRRTSRSKNRKSCWAGCLNTRKYNCCDETFQDITYNIRLKRVRLFHLINMVKALILQWHLCSL